MYHGHRLKTREGVKNQVNLAQLMKIIPLDKAPGDECGDCIWWYEGPILCEGCPHNPESEASEAKQNPNHGQKEEV